MITFERSFNYGLIRAILTHKAIWPHISDDSSPAADDYRPIESEAFWYVLVRDCDEVLGLFLFAPQNGVCWEVHTALLPHAWGDRAMQAALELPEWIWENTPCRRIVTNVPEYNKLALNFALDAGMRPYGRNEKSWLKGGRLWDQVCLGISAPDANSSDEVPTGLSVQEV